MEELSNQLHCWPLYPWGNSPQYLLYMRSGELKSQAGSIAEKISCPDRNQTSDDQLVAISTEVYSHDTLKKYSYKITIFVCCV
jgi:hypothetical protein